MIFTQSIIDFKYENEIKYSESIYDLNKMSKYFVYRKYPSDKSIISYKNLLKNEDINTISNTENISDDRIFMLYE